jgi:SH3-like domain-containing protein
MLISRTMRALACVLALAIGPAGTQAQDQQPTIGPVTKLPMPRFVSLRSRETNARRGPGTEYRKDWVYQMAGLPVQVVDEWGHWRRVVDSEGEGGWVYHALLSGRRTVVITAGMATLRDRPVETAVPVAKAERGVVAGLLRCEKRWCEVEIDGLNGWVMRQDLWGAEPPQG